MKKLVFAKNLVLLIALTTGWSLAWSYTGTMYELDSDHSKKLYTLKVDMKESGDLTDHLAEFMDSENKSIITETAVLKGTDVVKYHIDQKQTGEKGDVEIKDGKIFFNYTDSSGNKKEATEKYKEPFVMNVSFNRFVQKNWADLLAGKEIDIRYGVWYRRDTVGFSIKKMGEESKNGLQTIHIRMKPSSFVIAAIVDPVHMWYTQDGAKIVALKGRVAPKRKDGDKWKDLDADVDYLY